MTLSWPTGIALALGCFVTLQVSLVVLSARGFEGPDQVRYYKMGLEYSQEVERQQRQRQNGWQLDIEPRAEALPSALMTPPSGKMSDIVCAPGQPLRCRVLDAQGNPLSGSLKVYFKRPATLTLDHWGQVKGTPSGFEVEWQPQSGWWLAEFELESQGQRFVVKRRWWWP